MRTQANTFSILKLIILSVTFILGAIPASAMAVEVDLTRFLSDYERASGSPSASTDSFFGVAADRHPPRESSAFSTPMEP